MKHSVGFANTALTCQVLQFKLIGFDMVFMQSSPQEEEMY